MKETRFKQTEIGLIPEDWEIYDINNIGIFSKGAGISRNESMTGKIPAIRYGEIYTHHNNVLRNFNSWISVSVAAKSTKIKCNDLLFTASGETKEEIGKCVAYIYKYDAYAGGDIIILTPKNHYNSTFLGYLMNSKIICKQKASKGQGDAVVHITVNSLSKIKCPIPNSEEQNKIASALTSIDNLLLSLDKLIEKKRLIKQGAMQELLTGKKRLPGFTEKWIEKRLGELTKICTGKRNGDESRVFGKYPFFVRSQKVYRIDSFSFDGEAILVPGEGGIGDIFHYINGKFDYHQRVYKISNFNPSIIAMYVYYFMKFYFKEYALAQSVKATVESLRLPTFENFIIRYPNNVQEQKSIAKVLSSMDKEIESLEGKKAKYEQIKQGMMQQLLTGKIRLI